MSENPLPNRALWTRETTREPHYPPGHAKPHYLWSGESITTNEDLFVRTGEDKLDFAGGQYSPIVDRTMILPPEESYIDEEGHTARTMRAL